MSFQMEPVILVLTGLTNAINVLTIKRHKLQLHVQDARLVTVYKQSQALVFAFPPTALLLIL